MQKNYYQNILYPLQDKVISVIARLPVNFYLTGGTALSRAYLNHRYSDDLDFFVNDDPSFRKQVELIIASLIDEGLDTGVGVTGDSFARVLISMDDTVLKIDFVNDVPYRSGEPVNTSLFIRTDTIINILSNKLTALSRYSEKDVADLVCSALKFDFNWIEIIGEASKKDLWVNPVDAADILDRFPLEKLNDITWTEPSIDPAVFRYHLKILTGDLLYGRQNSLFK